jgi:4-amino-4-deoxy-L-arabinose transferase-like glycosyltransferase
MLTKIINIFRKRDCKPLDVVVFLVIFLAFIVRIYNLNYNSAFNDEGIYIVIGKLGLFQGDWYSYGANAWMAGSPYIYPVISALAYEIGGLTGSRFLNVILGIFLIEEVYRFCRLLNLFDEKTNKIAGIIAVFISGFCAIGIYVSRLATLDVLSFFLLIFALNCFLKSADFEDGKYYFLSAISLVIAFMTKIIIAVYLPALFLLSVFIIRRRPPVHKRLSLIYLYLVFAIAIAIYFLFNFNDLMAYLLTHKDMGKAENIWQLFGLINQVAGYGLLAAIPASTIMLIRKKYKIVLILALFAAIVPIFHLAINRSQTFNKHLYLTVIFSSVIVGYGLSLLILNGNKFIRYTTITLSLVVSLFFLNDSRALSYSLQTEWKDTTRLNQYLKQTIKSGDKILTENGGAVILALHDIIFAPKNITTFDWIDYSKLTGDRGYAQAVDDLYFDYIELDGQAAARGYLETLIRDHMESNYALVYRQDNFEIYKLKKNQP